MLFGLDDVPRPLTLALLGLQHFVVIAPNLAIVVLIARLAGAEPEAIATMISFALIVLAIATALQGLERIGSGFCIVSCNTAIYVSASIAAAAGGLPLVCGMTLLAGLIQILFAEVLIRMRRYFPPEIVALTIIIVGIELGAVGLQRVSTAGGPGLLIGALTFFLSVVLGVYGRGPLRLYCALIGMVSGYGLSAYAGLVHNELHGHALGKAIFAIPDLPVPRLDFDWGLVLPFAFAAIAASLKTMGAVVTCDKICDAGWVRPDMRLVRRGVIIDGLATALSGLAGAVGTNSSTASIGVSHATGATSRVIGFAVAGWMLLFALTPRFTYLFVAMPDPVVGGALVFAACLVMINGLQLLGTVPMDMRRAGVVAFPLILAIACVAKAPIFDLVPVEFKPMFSSALGISVFAALLANFFLSYGTVRRAEFALLTQPNIHEYMARIEEACATWNVAQNVKARVMLTLRERFDERCTTLRLQFDGYTLHLGLTRRIDTRVNLSETTHNSFFSDRISDSVIHRKRRGLTEVLSVYFEQ